MRILFILLIVSLFNLISYSQQFINWKNYTAMKNVQDVMISNDGFWSSTTGGVYHYSSGPEQFLTLHKSDGLKGTSFTSVTIDKLGRIWFGTLDGIIDVYNPATQTLNYILDIFNSNQTNKRINDLTSKGDTIIVSTDFGVSLIDVNTFLFYDTFFKFGTFTTNTRVNSTLQTDLFYVCTDEGIAIQKPGADNLSAPESWNVYSTLDGLPSEKTFKAAWYQNNLIVSTDKGFSRFENNTWNNFITELANVVINDFQVNRDSILIISQNKIFVYYNSVLAEIYSSPANVNLGKIEFDSDYGILCANNSGTLHLDLQLTGNLLSPNAPPVNQFPSLCVDTKNTLWSASGKDNTGVGYYRYDGESWFYFNRINQPVLPSNGVWSTYAARNGSVYLGMWGTGFVRVVGDSLTVFNRDNTGMQGIPDNPNYIVVSGFVEDSQNNLWVLNKYPVDRKPLSMRTSDTSWHHFLIPAAPNIVLDGYTRLGIDPYDTKWISCESRKGVFYFNENKTIEETTDDISGFLSINDGINTEDIRDVAVDRRGDVWVATSLGVNIITNTSMVFSSGNAGLDISSVFVLRQQSVNVIAVDPLNQKWIGTNEGLLLVNSDGSRLLTTFTAENSALLSNQIRSIAIDENNGIIYVGTDDGLTSFETPFIKPLENFDKLFVFPNPFYLNDRENLLTIDGLIRDTEIKILSISGTLVNQFFSPGGRTAYWDGKNDKGEFVNTGVYLIVAFDQEGNSVVTGKVAVLRE
jgi:ligand-binding sensor domain-containing protein